MLSALQYISFFVCSLVAIPVYVKQNISFFETGSSGRLEITVSPKQTMGKTVECVVVSIHMPKVVLSANLIATQGTYNYDPITKVTCCSTNVCSIYSLYLLWLRLPV